MTTKEIIQYPIVRPDEALQQLREGDLDLEMRQLRAQTQVGSVRVEAAAPGGRSFEAI